MKTILFVNACPRGRQSRTLRLAETFLARLSALTPGVRVIRQDLPALGLAPVDAERLEEKERLCDAKAWDAPMFSSAVSFQQADAVVIAAPYWDLSFPAILKIWVENMYVRNLTFRYENDRAIGLCLGRAAVYITTSGSPIGQHDWGAQYMRAVLQTLGIPAFSRISAEALDLDSSDVDAILCAAEENACREAERLAAQLVD